MKYSKELWQQYRERDSEMLEATVKFMPWEVGIPIKCAIKKGTALKKGMVFTDWRYFVSNGNVYIQGGDGSLYFPWRFDPLEETQDQEYLDLFI